jgi:hypothetical protein
VVVSKQATSHRPLSGSLLISPPSQVAQESNLTFFQRYDEEHGLDH